MVGIMKVKAYKHIDKPIESTNITHLIIGGKKHPNSKYNGMLIIALKGEKR